MPPRRTTTLLPLLALGACVCVAVPRLVAYTEIDWQAYVQEVEGPFVHGQWDYEQLRGDTGPLVYPAGFVYVFEGLRRATDQGRDIWRAQNIFAAIHVLLMAVVLLGVYGRTESTPVWALPLVVLSRRAHSIFELRLFNDGVAMVFAYASVACGAGDHWAWAAVLFSLGVSIKMNVILMAPAFAVLLLEARGFVGFVGLGVVCALIQLGLAWPFLMVNPLGYLRRSFDLGRVFMHEWTVNFKFLSEDVFQSRALALILLGLTLVTWLAFGHFRWSAKRGGLWGLLRSSLHTRQKLLPEHVITCMLESKVIGIVFSRSIHYQFYAWYVHALPYLIWRGRVGGWTSSKFSFLRRAVPGVALWLVIEVCYNVFPATPLTSALLQVAHLTLLVAAWTSPVALEEDFIRVGEGGKKTKAL